MAQRLSRGVVFVPSRTIHISERGIALIVAIIVVGVLSALGLSLLLTLALEPRASANQRDSAAALHAADAALELAALDLDRSSDWSAVLSGAVRSTRTDGSPSGTRVLADRNSLDLSELTSRLTCGRPNGCSDADRATSTIERPWGANNPQWQPFVYGAPSALGLSHVDADYVIVWVGDDGMEIDEDPRVDGGAVGEAGRLVVRLRALALGPRGARHSLEAVLVRRCDLGPERCDVGSYVQSWRSLHGAVP
jgi:hypothetical protein